jgi:hypothetical protein
VAVKNLAFLAELWLPVKASIHESMADNWAEVLTGLCQGDAFLIPYDADANNEPCNRKGHRAHWAVLTGFCATISAQTLQQKVPALSLDSNESLVDLWPFRHCIQAETIVRMLVDRQSTLFVMAQQGKSKRCQLFKWSALCDSNQNLVQVDPKRQTDEYLLPEAGFLDQLNNRYIRLRSLTNS